MVKINLVKDGLQRSYSLLQRGGWFLRKCFIAQSEVNKPKSTIAVLDGVRAVACLSVIAFHISLITRDAHIWNPGLMPLTGSVALAAWSGVTLFFVLSGFLLFMPYAKALLLKNNWPKARTFYLRRILRIIPGYYLALFLLIALQKPEYVQPAHWKDLLLFLTFFMDSTPATYQQINGPFWTLAVEWQFYLLLPLLALGFRLVVWRVPAGGRIWAVTGCLLGMFAWGIFSRYWGLYFVQYPTQTVLVPRRVLDVILFFTYGASGKYLEDFAIGMLVSLCYIFLWNVAREERSIAIARRLSPWFWGGGILCLLFMALWNYNQDYHMWPFFEGLVHVYVWTREAGFALGFGCCVMGILFGVDGLKRMFEWYPLRWVGQISYSLYMWHLPLLLFFMVHIGYSIEGWSSPVAYSLYWMWAALVVIPFAFLSYIFIEKPGMRLSEKLYRNKARLVLHK